MRPLITQLALIVLSALPLYARPQSGFYTTPELDEFRIELDDLKHALKTVQVDLGLLDERLKKQDHSLTQVKDQSQGKDASSLSLLTVQVNALEKKVSGLEKSLEKAANDLRTLNATSTQVLNKIQEVEQNLLSHEKRLDEVVKLKGTLTTISKAIHQRSSCEAPSSTKSYRVKAGDSLEKIARMNHISVEIIRKLNNLSSDKIVAGQELRLPDDPT
jgi:LysM repeat protein